MKKIVVLNSGGFDSVTLLNYLYKVCSVAAEIHSLHFLYGARNTYQQEKCVDKVCEKCGAVNMKIPIPPFSWTKSNFYGQGYDYETQYLEYRNLVFLSYALSYAQSIGADKIYLAIFKGNYADTCETFFKGLNSFSVPLTGIEICTPFSEYEDKSEILPYAIMTGVKVGDYFSCDTPLTNGKRCGECFDCKALDYIDSVLRMDRPFKALYQSGFDYSNPLFKELLSVPPDYREVRALVNNDCQLRCEHCFYGFEKMVSAPISREQYYKTLKDLVLIYGFSSIHFSGKEPLYGDDVLYYAERIKQDKLPCVFSVVTNGINLPSQIGQLKECGIEKVYLSADEMFGKVRSTHNVVDKAISSCVSIEVDVEIFIDLHTGNYMWVEEIMRYYIEAGVKSFTVRTIRSIGKAKEQILLSGKQLFEVFKTLDKISMEYPDVIVLYSISSEYIWNVGFYEPFRDIIDKMDSNYSVMWGENYSVFLERYCHRYEGITITPDGYVLGCASEVSRPDYDRIAAGNIMTDSLPEILKRGNHMRVECAEKFLSGNCSCMVNKI